MKRQQNANHNRFYVYIYRDPRTRWTDLTLNPPQETYVPFLIGKGFGNRINDHLKETEENTINRIKYFKIQKIKSNNLEPIIEKYAENLTQQEAFDLEEKLIQQYGRNVEPCSPLTNLINGGLGGWAGIPFSEQHCKNLSKSRLEKIASGEIVYPKGEDHPWFGRKQTEESKKKTGDANRGKKRTEEQKKAISLRQLGKKKKPCSEERKKKIGDANRGKKRTEEQIQNHIKKITGRKNTQEAKNNIKNGVSKKISKTYEITDPNGNKEIIFNLNEYCRKMGFPGSGNLVSVSKGKLKHYKQYKCRLIQDSQINLNKPQL